MAHDDRKGLINKWVHLGFLPYYFAMQKLRFFFSFSGLCTFSSKFKDLLKVFKVLEALYVIFKDFGRSNENQGLFKDNLKIQGFFKTVHTLVLSRRSVVILKFTEKVSRSLEQVAGV